MKLFKFWGRFIVVPAVLYLLFGGNRGLWNLYRLHQEKIILASQISQLKNEINQNQTEYKNYEKNSLVMEKLAREELNLVKPGELVYKFTEDRVRQ